MNKTETAPDGLIDAQMDALAAVFDAETTAWRSAFAANSEKIASLPLAARKRSLMQAFMSRQAQSTAEIEALLIRFAQATQTPIPLVKSGAWWTRKDREYLQRVINRLAESPTDPALQSELIGYVEKSLHGFQKWRQKAARLPAPDGQTWTATPKKPAPRRFVRIPEKNACQWCILVSIPLHNYHTMESAGVVPGGNRFHRSCRCMVFPENEHSLNHPRRKAAIQIYEASRVAGGDEEKWQPRAERFFSYLARGDFFSLTGEIIQPHAQMLAQLRQLVALTGTAREAFLNLRASREMQKAWAEFRDTQSRIELLKYPLRRARGHELTTLEIIQLAFTHPNFNIYRLGMTENQLRRKLEKCMKDPARHVRDGNKWEIKINETASLFFQRENGEIKNIRIEIKEKQKWTPQPTPRPPRQPNPPTSKPKTGRPNRPSRRRPSKP